ncbi:MAG: FliG C-terminal domain-containing protein [Pirellulales bacterium]
MDLLNRAMQQGAELLRTMTPRARLATAALAGVLLICAVGLLLSPSAGSEVLLLGGHAFSTSELPAVQAAFAKAGLSDFEVVGGQIRIPRNHQARYLAALADGDVLPSSLADRLVEIVQAQSPFASRAQQEQMQRAVVQSMIAKSIARMSGVESAELFLDTQPRRGFRQEPLSTASVHVKTIGSVPLSADKVRAIRGLVAGAVAGMAPDNVTVIDSTGQHWSGESAVGSGGLDDPYLARKLTYEKGYAAKILASLAYVPGVSVSVNVELSTERRRTGSRQTIEPNRAAPSSAPRATLVDGDPTSDSLQATHNQRPNQPAALDAPGDRLPRAMPIAAIEPMPTNEAVGQRTATIDNEQFEIVGLTPERVTVSVVVPTTYFEDLWRRHNAVAGQAPLRSPSPLELAPIEVQERVRIQETVLAQIPHAAGLSAADLVSVTAFTPIPTAPVGVPPWSVRVRNWLQLNWVAVGLIVLPLAALCYLGMKWRAPRRSLPQSRHAVSGGTSFDATLDDSFTPGEELVTADGYRYALDDDEIESPGVDPNHRAAGNSRQPGRAAPPNHQHAASSGVRPFDLLCEASGRDIADLLAGEQPQTIAVVIGHLPPERAAEVVDFLPPALQADVMRRVVQLEATPFELLHEIESALVARLAEVGLNSARRGDGKAAAQRILAAGGPDFAARLARRLAPHDRELATQLEATAAAYRNATMPIGGSAVNSPAPHESTWGFEELDRLSDADLRYVAAAANRDLLEIALAGATPELAERVLRALAPDQSRALRNRLDQLAPTRMSDIEQAQREIARLAFELLASTRDSATTGTRLVA